MTVSMMINLPDDVYRVLVAQAHRCDTQAHKLVEAAVTRSARGDTRRQAKKARAGRAERLARDERIKELNALGWSDNRIARELGISQGTVSPRRKALGLPRHFAKFGKGTAA